MPAFDYAVHAESPPFGDVADVRRRFDAVRGDILAATQLSDLLFLDP